MSFLCLDDPPPPTPHPPPHSQLEDQPPKRSPLCSPGPAATISLERPSEGERFHPRHRPETASACPSPPQPTPPPPPAALSPSCSSSPSSELSSSSRAGLSPHTGWQCWPRSAQVSPNSIQVDFHCFSAASFGDRVFPGLVCGWGRPGRAGARRGGGACVWGEGWGQRGGGGGGGGGRGGGGGTGTQLPSASVCLRPGKEITHQAGSEKGNRSGDRARLFFAESLRIEQAVASLGLPALRTVHPSWTQASGTPGVRLSVRCPQAVATETCAPWSRRRRAEGDLIRLPRVLPVSRPGSQEAQTSRALSAPDRHALRIQVNQKGGSLTCGFVFPSEASSLGAD